MELSELGCFDEGSQSELEIFNHMNLFWSFNASKLGNEPLILR